MNMLKPSAILAAAAALPAVAAFAPVARLKTCSPPSELAYANANNDNDESNNRGDNQWYECIDAICKCTGDKDSQLGDPLSLFDESTSISKSGAFDCILDSGVLNSILSSIPSEVTWHSRAAPTALLDLAKLVSEANKAIREFGIYVAITEESIPPHARGYLNGMGEVMGMEWTYDLDGVSREDRYFVTVARKYRTGPVNLDTGKGSVNLLRP